MSRGLNKWMVIGNIGKNPEMRYTPSGKAVTTFSVAVNNSFTGADGNKVEDTTWVDCEAWGKPAESINEFVKKGDKLYVEGRAKTDKWEKDGINHSRTKLVVREWMFVSSNGATEEAAEEPAESFEFSS